MSKRAKEEENTNPDKSTGGKLVEQKEFTLEMLEEAAEKVFKENPYPKYLGEGLYQVADNCIVGEKMMKVIDEGLIEKFCKK